MGYIQSFCDVMAGIKIFSFFFHPEGVDHIQASFVCCYVFKKVFGYDLIYLH